MALAVVDRAMQAFGAEGLSQDQDLAVMWTSLRTLRIADVCFIFRLFLGA
jgi:acyl-CoA dehydrogenase